MSTLGMSFTPTVGEAIEAVTTAAYPIMDECPTCHNGEIDSGKLGVWAGYDQTELSEVIAAIKSSNFMEWYHGLPDWWLSVDTLDDPLRVDPPASRLRQLEIEAIEARLARLKRPNRDR